jgi:hypothetical protein
MTQLSNYLQISESSKKTNSDVNFDIINKTITGNKNDKQSVLKMKTFSDLQLDLKNLIKKDEDKEFLSNIFNSKNAEKKKKQNSDESYKQEFFKQIPNNIDKSKEHAEKLYDLINKLKQEKR